MRFFGGTLESLIRCGYASPRRVRRLLHNVPTTCAAQEFALRYQESAPPPSEAVASPPNPLEQFFEGHESGPGIWKWRHYFEIYHRHLSKFRGHAAHVAEIGIFSGGSLRMWRSYFGDACQIHGIDLDDSTRAFSDDRVTIHVGDQEDRGFWARFRQEVPTLDVLIDDGGHTPQQQRVSLEEVLPHLRWGGVYICEDIHGEGNAFASYVAGLIDQLNALHGPSAVPTTSFQASIGSIHVYPFVVVIEKRSHPLRRLSAERRGSEWRPPLIVREGYGTIQGRGA